MLIFQCSAPARKLSGLSTNLASFVLFVHVESNNTANSSLYTVAYLFLFQRQSCDLAQSYTCHRTVSTEMYHKLQEMYINQSCAEHLSDISMACRDCFKLKCRHCRSSSSQPLPLCQGLSEIRVSFSL